MDFLTTAGIDAVDVAAGGVVDVATGGAATGVEVAGVVWLPLDADPSALLLDEPHPTTGMVRSDETITQSKTLFIGVNHWKACLSA